MNNMIYIFGRVDELTSSYHSSGGLVVVAKDKREARKLISEFREDYSSDCHIKITEDEWNNVRVGRTDLKPAIMVFPDEGCC